MVENSSAGLFMLDPAVTVTVTREEHHQPALSRYQVASGQSRRVAVELRWCAIAAGKYQGRRGIEVRLDGRRVGELTHATSQRYARFVEAVTAQHARPGCEATVEEGKRGLELRLHLPRHTDPLPVIFPPAVHTRPHLVPVAPHPGPAAPRKSSAKPIGIAAAAVIGIGLVMAIASGGDDVPTAAPVDFAVTTTATTLPTTTVQPTTTATTTTTTTTTTKAPVTTTKPPVTTTRRPQPPPAPAPATTAKPRPRPTTTQPKPAPAPQPKCDPNYSGCVPIASDVDCAGGSGNGPAYASGPIRVTGSDIYDLDRDGDGTACE
ncbi:hypothetical protein ACTG9Q_18680 [Actinokineospora sp. 24-640]